MTRTKYYHVDEVAELLGVSHNEVRDMLKRKELKGHKLGRRWLIDMQQSCFENLTLPTPPPIPKKQKPPLYHSIKAV